MRSYAIFARCVAGVMLMLCWGLVDSPLLGVGFLLALTALSAVRYRFSPYRWIGVAEILLCVGFAFMWLPALLGLWLPVIGLLEDKWADREKELLRTGFEDREARLKLEVLHDASAQEIRSVARLAEMSERSRIAQDIHDNVGHEISGAAIAIQTAIKLYDNGDERAGELLVQSAKRLETASEQLREAVHNLKPARVAGVSTLAELCEAFTFCPVQFSASGDLGGSIHWDLLEANLKEALTNVSRHSKASLVTVKLDGNADFLRLQVSDNGGKNEDGARVAQSTDKRIAPSSSGLGLAGIRERVRAVGGTLTVSAECGFTVVCILPKQ